MEDGLSSSDAQRLNVFFFETSALSGDRDRMTSDSLLFLYKQLGSRNSESSSVPPQRLADKGTSILDSGAVAPPARDKERRAL
jgi:hypothetical protein